MNLDLDPELEQFRLHLPGSLVINYHATSIPVHNCYLCFGLCMRRLRGWEVESHGGQYCSFNRLTICSGLKLHLSEWYDNQEAEPGFMHDQKAWVLVDELTRHVSLKRVSGHDIHANCATIWTAMAFSLLELSSPQPGDLFLMMSYQWRILQNSLYTIIHHCSPLLQPDSSRRRVQSDTTSCPTKRQQFEVINFIIDFIWDGVNHPCWKSIHRMEIWTGRLHQQNVLQR